MFSSGNAKDKLAYHNGRNFSTKNQDNDSSSENCAAVGEIRGAWWFGDCKHSNLNGVYRSGADSDTMVWGDIRSVKRTEMKIRPKEL